jgi:exodeoxyribonuclease VII large subunit
VDPQVLTVGEFQGLVEAALNSTLDRDFWVSGEIQKISVSSAGHCYIDLADSFEGGSSQAAVLHVIAWRSVWNKISDSLSKMQIILDPGMVIKVRGNINYYKPRGQVGLVIDYLDIDALLGRLKKAREKLIASLIEQKLLRKNASTKLPRFPLKIALVASPKTEGYKDFVGQVVNSGFRFEITSFATSVQGEDAPSQIVDAFDSIDYQSFDAVVIVRGGGARADLGAFDDEQVVLKIANCPIPVLSGIGHTGDMSIADMVAYRSFITPTACGKFLAETVHQNYSEIVQKFLTINESIDEIIEFQENKLEKHRFSLYKISQFTTKTLIDEIYFNVKRLNQVTKHRVQSEVKELVAKQNELETALYGYLSARSSDLRLLGFKLMASKKAQIKYFENKIANYTSLIAAYNPASQLKRGWSMTYDKDGKIIKSIKGLNKGELITTRVADGEVVSETIELRSVDGSKRRS